MFERTNSTNGFFPAANSKRRSVIFSRFLAFSRCSSLYVFKIFSSAPLENHRQFPGEITSVLNARVHSPREFHRQSAICLFRRLCLVRLPFAPIRAGRKSPKCRRERFRKFAKLSAKKNLPIKIIYLSMANVATQNAKLFR